MRRKIYLIGGFGLGWKKVMLQLIDAATKTISDGTMNLQLSKPASKEDDSFFITSEDGNTDIEFTTLKWNDITRKYYQGGLFKFWSQIAKMYLTFLKHSDLRVVKRLPWSIVFLFIIAPFAIVLLFIFFSFFNWVLISTYFDLPTGVLAITIFVLSSIGTAITLDSASVVIFLRGLLFSADSFVSEPSLLDDHIKKYKEKILKDLRAKDYDEIIVLGFSHGCNLLILLISDLYGSGENKAQDKIKALFVAHYLPLGLLLKNKTKLSEAVLKLKNYDVTFFNVYNSYDSVCSSKNALFFPYDNDVKARVANLDTKYEECLPWLEKLKAKYTFHYAHTLYFRPLGISCQNSMIQILCSPQRLEKNAAFSLCTYSNQRLGN